MQRVLHLRQKHALNGIPRFIDLFLAQHAAKSCLPPRNRRLHARLTRLTLSLCPALNRGIHLPLTRLKNDNDDNHPSRDAR